MTTEVVMYVDPTDQPHGWDAPSSETLVAAILITAFFLVVFLAVTSPIWVSVILFCYLKKLNRVLERKLTGHSILLDEEVFLPQVLDSIACIAIIPNGIRLGLEKLHALWRATIRRLR